MVCVAPNAKIPVCRFMDYSKYRYEQQKKARESRKNQKVINVKELWLSPVISDNDFETKLRQGRKFLESGDKLKITLRYGGRRVRMLANESENNPLIEKIIERTADIATVESKGMQDGKSIYIVLNPKK